MIDIKIEGKFPNFGEIKFQAVKDVVAQRAGDTVCPDHHEKATITIHVLNEKDYNVNVRTCCEKWNAEILKRIQG